MTNKKFGHIMWQPKAKPKDDFPFTYDIISVPEEDTKDFLEKNSVDLTIEYYVGTNLKKLIKEELISIFPFYRYTDVNSDEYIGRDNNLVYNLKINVYNYTKDEGKKPKKSTLIKTWAVRLVNFHTNYQFNMVRSTEQLKSILNVEIPYMSFDLETSGLDPEDDIITGASFSLEPRIGYYVPIETVAQYKHKTLGYEALDVLYAAMLRAMIVLLFNAEFDIRKMRFSKRKYDMSKIKFIDVQLPAWYMDTDNKNTSLKWFEKYFLGYYRKDLNETMQTYGLDTFDTSKIDPDHILFYGAQDGISTYELFFVVEEYLKEFGLSGQIDLQLIYPFMIMKEHPTDINIKLLEEELNYIILRLGELDKLMDESIGDINLNSSTQKAALFKSFGLDTGVKTNSGAMSTSKDAIDGLIEKMENNNQPIPEWLQYMGERSKLEKLRSTYYGSLKEQVGFYNGKVRINYRNTNASTGRLSSGKFIYE